jgi:hypothetical protein
VFLCFQLRHSEQEAEHVELVLPRQPGQVGGGLCNKGCGLIRAALPAWLIGSRTPRLALICARPSAPCFGQKLASNAASYRGIPFFGVQL